MIIICYIGICYFVTRDIHIIFIQLNRNLNYTKAYLPIYFIQFITFIHHKATKSVYKNLIFFQLKFLNL